MSNLIFGLARTFIRLVATLATFHFGRAQNLRYVVLIWTSWIIWLHYQFWWEGLPMAAWVGTYSGFAFCIAWTLFRKFMRGRTDLFEV